MRRFVLSPAGRGTKPTTSIFGSSSSAAPSTAATTLFAATTTTTASSTPLFGTAPAATQASTGLFGTPTAVASTGATTSLFSSAATATPAKPLFGAATTTTASSLFGTPAAASTTTGLGGAAAAATTIGGVGIGGGLGANVGEVKQEAQVENAKEAKVEQLQLDLLNAVRNAVAENKKYSDEFACQSNDECLKIEDRVRQLERRISAISVTSSSLSASEEKLRSKTTRDVRLGQIATAIQENAAKNIYTTNNQGRMYMIELIREYNCLLGQYAQTIEQLQQRVQQLQNGVPSVSEKDVSDHLLRFDAIFSHVAAQIVATSDKISELKEIFNEKYPGVLVKETIHHSLQQPSSYAGSAAAARRMAGEPALPSQATALQIGQYLRQSGAPAATTTTGGLFGSMTTGGGLFGASSTTAAKPYSFATPAAATTGTSGSLFGVPNGAAAPSTSLFGSTTSAPATSSSLTFGKSIANSSSGLLFSSTKPLFGK